MASMVSASNRRTEEGDTMELKPCPICGKRPKVKRDYAYEGSGFGAWCTIQCKSFFRKPHLKVEAGKAQWERALICAVEEWNRRVSNEHIWDRRAEEGSERDD